jgi:hypothetical protein
VFADIPKYFGYDWIDPYPNTAMMVYDKVKSHTNLNIVHSFTSLGSSACADGKCALNVWLFTLSYTIMAVLG